MNIPRTTDDIESFKGKIIDHIKNEVYLLLLDTDYVDVLNKKEPLFKPDWVEWRKDVRHHFYDYISLIQNSSSISQIENILANVSWPEPPGICFHLRRPPGLSLHKKVSENTNK